MHNQEAPPPSTSDSGPMMHSNLRMLPRAILSLSQSHSRHIRRNRRRSGSLCSLCIPHNLYSLRRLWHLRSHGNHRTPALRAARRYRRFHCR
jgi:hypothetical protein